MDIGPIGSHCAKTLCNDLDFLPIKCTHCSSTFCRHHISPPAHDCTAVDKKVGDSPSDWVSRTKCAVEGCDKPSLDSAFTTDRVEDEIDAVGGARRNGVTCSDCGSAYCVIHRYPETHNCSETLKVTMAPDKNAAAKALLAKAFPNKKEASGSPATTSSLLSTSDRNGKPSDPGKIARLRQVELMRMRQRAVPADPKHKNGPQPPMEKRRHVIVKVREGKTADKVFWVQKDIITGRALDLFCTQMKVSSVGKRVQLQKEVEGEGVVLKNDGSLGMEVDEGESVYIVVSGNN